MSESAPDFKRAVDAFWKEVRLAIDDASNHCYATTDCDVQVQHCEQLNELAARGLALKGQAIEAREENAANALLSMEYLMRCAFGGLCVWLNIKNGEMSKAWNALVEAQGHLRCAMKAHRIGEGMKGFGRQLREIESAVFPPQRFVSSSLLIGHYECSICGEEYGTCGHVVGRPYMGELCSKLAKEVTSIDHIAVLIDSEPRDKRCRLESLTRDDGSTVDLLTGLVSPPEPARKEPPEPGHTKFRACVLHATGEEGT